MFAYKNHGFDSLKWCSTIPQNVIWIIEIYFLFKQTFISVQNKTNILYGLAIVLQTLISDHYNLRYYMCFIYICWFTLHVGKSQLNTVINYNNYYYFSKNQFKITSTYVTYKIVHQAPIILDGHTGWSSESSLAWPLDASKLICKNKT